MSDAAQATPTPAPTPPETSLELKKYQEDLAIKYGLPSPFQTGLLKQMAFDMVASGMVPAHFKSNPMAVYMAITRGREMGLEPMESVLESFWAAPGGRLGLYAAKMLDLIHRKGIRTKFIREDKDGCEILFTPPGDHDPYTARFFFEEAKTARLVKEDSKDSNWYKWPADMCRARAISRGWRALAGVVGAGGATPYSKEELDDMEYETVSPANGSTPEVQVPKEEPAKAGRKPKEKTITVEPVQETASGAQHAGQEPSRPAPVQETAAGAQQSNTAPAQTFYVVPSTATLPALDKIEEAPIVQFKIAAAVIDKLPDAMKVCDKLTRDTGVEHYILQFEAGRAKKLHTSKIAAPRMMYLAVEESAYKASTTTADITNAAFNRPHHDKSTTGLVAAAKAKELGKPCVVISFMEGGTGTWNLDQTFQPPPAPPVETKPEPAKTTAPTTDAAPAATVNPALEEKKKLRAHYEALGASLPLPPQAQLPAINKFIMAYMQITDMKIFPSDLPRAWRVLDACARAIKEYPDFASDGRPEKIGEIMRTREAVDKPAANLEADAMAKYYEARGWTGMTTSYAEAWRKSNGMSPVEFERTQKMSGIEACSNKDAAAFFALSNKWKDVGARLAVEIEPDKYFSTLSEILDAFEGASLEQIEKVRFVEVLDRILKSKDEAGGDTLFG